MRVWQIIPYTNGGGAEKMVNMLQDRMEQEGICSSIISFFEVDTRKSRDIKSLGVSWPYNPLIIFRLFRLLRLAAKKGEAPDIIHTHLTPAQLLTPLAVSLSRCRPILITTEHSTFNKRRKMVFGSIIDRLMYRSYSVIICISKGSRDSLKKWQPSLIGKFVTIYNGIELNQFRDSRRLKTLKQPITIISVGRLVPLKNYEAAIKAIASLRNLDIEYQIVGTGPEEESLRQLIKEQKVDQCVRLLGWQDDVPSLLRKADIFLLTSHWEGFGLSVTEAMAAGLPVVVSNLQGVKEVVGKDGDCGYLVCPTNLEEIVNKLRQLICNFEQRVILGNNGVKRVQQFSINKTVKSHAELYRRLITENNPQTNPKSLCSQGKVA